MLIEASYTMILLRRPWTRRLVHGLLLFTLSISNCWQLVRVRECFLGVRILVEMIIMQTEGLLMMIC